MTSEQKGVDVLAVINFLADEAAYASILYGDSWSDDDEKSAKFGRAASDAVRAHVVVAELIAAATDLKDVCNRPSAARTRAEAWKRLDRALAATRSQP